MPETAERSPAPFPTSDTIAPGRTLTRLVDATEAEHHERLRAQLHTTIEEVRRATHGRDACAKALEQLVPFLERLRVALDWHLTRIEGTFFPLCREIDAAVTLPQFPGGSVRVLIESLLAEHTEIERELAEMRQLLSGFDAVYAGARSRTSKQQLSDLEHAVNRVLKRERERLFPLAIRVESRLKYER